MKMYKWDPIWGVNNKIFFLGAKFEKDKPFFSIEMRFIS